jgi:hypothetical protein
MTLHRSATIFGASLLLIASLAGCSASSAPDASKAPNASSAPATSDASGVTTEMTKERATSLSTDYEARVKKYQDGFKDCVVDKGVDLDSVSTSKDPRMKEAMDACTKELGETPAPSAEEQAGIRYMNQLTLGCLRDKGHEVDDLQPDGSLPNTGNRDDAYFADVKACEASNH